MISIKKVRFLKDKKARQEMGLIVVEGEKVIREYLRTGKEPKMIIVDQARKKKIPTDLWQNLRQWTLIEISSREFRTISPFETPQPVMMVVDYIPPTKLEKDTEPTDGILLDRIQDPGNVGALIRSAYWFGFHKIYLSPECADIWNPKVIRASMGAVFHVRWIQFEEIRTLLDHFKRLHTSLILSTLDGKDVRSVSEIRSPFVLVVGNESTGIHPDFLKADHLKVQIPGKNDFDSLNAAISASILMYHFKVIMEKSHGKK